MQSQGGMGKELLLWSLGAQRKDCYLEAKRMLL